MKVYIYKEVYKAFGGATKSIIIGTLLFKGLKLNKRTPPLIPNTRGSFGK